MVPLTKSIKDGEWEQVILLPSRVTTTLADTLSNLLASYPIASEPLKRAGDENSVDACYTHYCTIIAGLLESDRSVADIVPDYTRGTKSMSAALVLAAMRFSLPRLRYIHGEKRDHLGLVVPGTEIVGQFETNAVSQDRLLDQARLLFERGNYSAAIDLIADTAHGRNVSHLPEAQISIHSLAGMCAAWERFDYKEALRRMQAAQFSHLPGSWRALQPSNDVASWLQLLASELPNVMTNRATAVQRIAADLYANGLRRIERLQLEDAWLRAYRLVELMLQIQQLKRNENPDRIRENLFRQIETMKKHTPAAGRTLAKLLARAQDRNQSILAHGLKAIAGSDLTKVRRLYRDIAKEFQRDNSQFEQWVHLSQWLRSEEPTKQT